MCIPLGEEGATMSHEVDQGVTHLQINGSTSVKITETDAKEALE